MQHNLEEIGFEEVKDEKGLSYAVFRNQLKPIYRVAAFDIVKGYLSLGIVSLLVIWGTQQFNWLWWVSLIVGSVLIGYVAAYLALFIHEAGHFNLHPDKKMNDRMANILLCLPFGLSIRSYRKIHWQHHVHLGTPDDTEVSYFNALTKLFLVESLTGIHLLRTMLKKNKATVLNNEQLVESRKMLLAGIFLHAVILATSLLTNNWPFAIAWIAGFGIFFPFFATLRQVLEHRDELAQCHIDFSKQPHGKVSRLFVHGLLSSSFGSAGFTRHMIHHWDPKISYTRLKDIETFLLQSEKTAPIIINSRTRYFKVLKKLLAAS